MSLSVHGSRLKLNLLGAGFKLGSLENETNKKKTTDTTQYKIVIIYIFKKKKKTTLPAILKLLPCKKSD